MTGSSNVTSLVNADTSTIVFSAPVGDPTQLASYKTLTTVNYTGMGGESCSIPFSAATARRPID